MTALDAVIFSAQASEQNKSSQFGFIFFDLS